MQSQCCRSTASSHPLRAPLRVLEGIWYDRSLKYEADRRGKEVAGQRSQRNGRTRGRAPVGSAGLLPASCPENRDSRDDLLRASEELQVVVNRIASKLRHRSSKLLLQIIESLDLIGAKRWLIHDSVSCGSSLSECLSAPGGKRENLYSEYHKHVEQASLRETRAWLSREVLVCPRGGSRKRGEEWTVAPIRPVSRLRDSRLARRRQGQAHLSPLNRSLITTCPTRPIQASTPTRHQTVATKERAAKATPC